MAERRMISKKVVLNDDFLALSTSAKSLYLFLVVEADDDGLLKNTKAVTAYSGANKRTLEALCNKGFLISFRSGVVALRHWKIHNLIPKDRYKPTIYQKEFSQLQLNSSGEYEFRDDSEEFLSRFL